MSFINNFPSPLRSPTAYYTANTKPQLSPITAGTAPAGIESIAAVNDSTNIDDYIRGPLAIPSNSLPPGLQPLPEYCQLSPLVWTILGLNSGYFTLQGTNIYLLGTGPDRILIDTGDGNNSKVIDNILKVMKLSGCEYISRILITHWHSDHTGGLSVLLPILESQPEQQNHPILIYKSNIKQRGSVPDSIIYNEISAEMEWKVGDCIIKPILTPGHTADHCCFIMESRMPQNIYPYNNNNNNNNKQQRYLFSGDCILGFGTSVFRHLEDYLQSLNLLYSSSITIIYPAHGPIILNGRNKIKDYIDHRYLRDMQILDLLYENPNSTIDNLYEKMYYGLNQSLKSAAIANVLLHMAKLKREKKINGKTPSPTPSIYQQSLFTATATSASTAASQKLNFTNLCGCNSTSANTSTGESHNHSHNPNDNNSLIDIIDCYNEDIDLIERLEPLIQLKWSITQLGQQLLDEYHDEPKLLDE